ncbi:MAG TPA: FAD-binding oxidoreductase [Acidimicrobiales bacterium]|nr:FAD-binding oxidoreductase [Acidimicrobiales bacterium]
MALADQEPSTSAAGPAWDAYRRRVDQLLASYRSIPADTPVRLAKKTSNLFRTRSAAAGPRLDVSGFDGVIEIDARNRWADVQGMTTYEHLVDALLPYGLMPLVVPELKTITIGGAVTGLGIESSSFRNGMPHESVIEMDILTGAGEIVTARPEGEHRDLFHGFPNSYGSLGYVLRARIELEDVRPYVHLRHLRFDSTAALIEALPGICDTRTFGGERVDFVDGTVFSPTECYLTLGGWADSAPAVSDYTWTDIYYRSIQSRQEDWLGVRDYLWRWDTDWFWCSRAFYAQKGWVRRLAGPRLLRSDVYWKIMAFEARHHWKSRLDSMLGKPARENVIQDVELPLGRLEEFLAGFQREVPISPFWLCPLRQRDPSAAWDLYRLDPAELYVNVGFWSSVELAPGMDPDRHNRWVEDEVDRLGGRKSLYSTAFYDEQRFWHLYNGPVYRRLKERYDPAGRLLDMYTKCVGSR